MKKTFLELMEADSIVANLYQEKPLLRKGKFAYGYSKFYRKNYQPILDEIQEKMSDERINNALVDKDTKAILYEADGKTYKFDKDGMRRNVEFERKLLEEYKAKEIECEPYITTEEIELTEEQRAILTGILI